MKIFITGKPGVGKTTIFMEVVGKLRDKYKICGFITPEVRSKGKRIGFKAISLNRDDEIWLAKVGRFSKGVRFGKYTVFAEEFERFLGRNLGRWGDFDVVAIDEIGKMEMFSRKFENLVEEILKSDKMFLGVLHRNFVKKYQRYGKVYEVTLGNREEVKKEITELVKGL